MLNKNLTKKECEFLSEFKSKIDSDLLLRQRIMAATYLIGEIENQFGCDVMEFIINYQSGLMQNCGSTRDGDLDVMEIASGHASNGFGIVQNEINEIIAECVYDKINIELSEEKRRLITTVVDELCDSCK
jgi:hypothetical protein